MWNIVTENKNAPQNQGGQAKYLLQRDRTLATIVLSVDPTLLYLLVADPENPAVVCKKLADLVQKKTWANKLNLRRKLYNLKLKDRQSMQKHVKMLTEIFYELSIIVDSLEEENQVARLLASLPQSNDVLVLALEASIEVPKLEVVTEKLLHEETKEQTDKEFSTIEVKAMASKHQTSSKGPKCHHCGRFGHIKRECKMLLGSPKKN